MSQFIQHVNLPRDQGEFIAFKKVTQFLGTNRWLIFFVTFVVTLVGTAYVFIASPTYQANILIQVEDTSTGSGAGSGAKNIQDNLSGAFDMRTVTASEIEVIRSRSVVTQAAENADLYIDVRPKYFPVVGEWISRHNKALSEPGILGYGGYVWGSERAEVTQFKVPPSLHGKTFTLTVIDEGSFQLVQREREIDVEGAIGKTLVVPFENDRIELHVAALEAKPGAAFLVTYNPPSETVQKLQRNLKIAEKGKQSGIIELVFNGTNPALISRALNEIGEAYIRQNIEKKTEKAQKSLAFLEARLPDLKQELERSENEYRELRNKNATFSLGDEARALREQFNSVQLKLGDAEQRRAGLLRRLEPAHPAVQTLSSEISELNKQLAALNAKLKVLPNLEQDEVRLSRNVKVNTELYTALLSTAQELRLATSSEVGNARLLDKAKEPIKPTSPTPAMFIPFFILCGLVAGVVVAWARKRFYGLVDDPEEIERLLGLPVSARIPFIDEGKPLLMLHTSENQTSRRPVPQLTTSSDVIEGLRRLRAFVQLSRPATTNNIIMITGPTSGVGKSFVAANFSVVLASIGKRVLLIDADLRSGELHRYFCVPRGRGLSNVIMDGASVNAAIHHNVEKNVDLLTTGDQLDNPAEQLAYGSFDSILNQVASRYDFVVIDTAPVLEASDAVTVAAYAGSIFNIVRRNVSSVEDIDNAYKELMRAGHGSTSIVFNDLKSRPARAYGSSSSRRRDFSQEEAS